VGRGSLLERLGIDPARPAQVARLVREVRAHLAGSFNRKPRRPSVEVFVGAFGPQMLELARTGWADEVRPPGIWDVHFLEDVKARLAVGDPGPG